MFLKLCKIHRKAPVPQPIFIPATLLKKKAMFSDEFCKIFQTPFYRTPPSDCFYSNEKYFTNKLRKTLSKKNKKWTLLVRKTTPHAEKKLKHYLPQVLISFYCLKKFFIPHFIASHDKFKACIFKNYAVPLKIYLL